jgi:site-specific DNA-methyltransferase (adenine-specific)/modification methylase
MKPYFERDGLALFLGDCREIMPELGERMDPGACQLAFTSPPYNISLRMKNGQYAKRKRGDDNFSAKYTHFDDALLPAEYYALLHDSLVEMLKIAPIIFLNMQIATGNKQSLFQIIGEFGGFIKDLIIWDKGSGAPAIQENTLNRCYELLFVLERDGQLGRSFSHSHFPKGTMNDIWRFGRSEKVSADNAAVFPEELVALAIENWTTPNAVVLDPFCGTGTTLLAALNCGREGIGIDISEAMLETAAKRLEAVPLFSLPVPVSKESR